jgi:sugar/nucleoside kinase (ribokinase family)
MEVEVVPAECTSTFENVYTANGRIQTLHHVAQKITAADIPARWQNPAIVHLAPLTDEVDPAIIHKFPNSIIGLTPQGWMRQWDENGRITPKLWQDAAKYLPYADVIILSQEDLLTPKMVFDYWDWSGSSGILVLTGGPKGAIVFYEDRAKRIPTINVQEVEATGAGDVFATAYLLRYHQTKDPVESARFANIMAACSVTQSGLDNIAKIIREKHKTYG